MIEARMSLEQLAAFLDLEFPQIHDGGRVFTLLAAGAGSTRMRMAYAQRLLRPGGTISGPAMFALADVAFYAAVLSAAGPVPLAVTTNMNINFLRRPEPRAMIAEATLLKFGRRLAVGEVRLYSEGAEAPAAHATGTYSLPPAGRDDGGS